MCRYGDKVRIKEGFYKNLFGILIECQGGDVYTAEISVIDGNNGYRTKEIMVLEEEIEILQENK